ncbi:MAG: DNRLRE domain-containing protein [Thermoplasmatales archaeon]|nr:MAG: DNRLRE domain-containing protein [Thermoplasmatales archaeon]
MSNYLLKKTLVLVTIILLFGVSSVSALNTNIQTNDILISIENPDDTIENFYPTDDSKVVRRFPDTNYGNNGFVTVSNRYGATPDWGCDTFIKFDISNIPENHRIDSATLYLYYYAWTENNPEGRPLTVYRVKEDWSEDTITFNNQPEVEDTASSSANVPDYIDTWMTIDLTEDVIFFHKDENANFGWKIMDETYWGTHNIPAAYFYSKDCDDEDYHPYLEVHSTKSRAKNEHYRTDNDYPSLVSILAIYNRSDIIEMEFNVTHEFKLLGLLRQRSYNGIYKDIKIIPKKFNYLRIYKFPYIRWDIFLLDSFDDEFVELRVDKFLGLFTYYYDPRCELIHLNGIAIGVELIYPE